MAQAGMANQRSARATLAAMIQMTKAMQGGDITDLERPFQKVILDASTAIGSNFSSKGFGNNSSNSNLTQPMAARMNSTVVPRSRIRSANEGPKSGAKKAAACTFCGKHRHNIQACPSRVAKGRHIVAGTEFIALVSLLVQGKVASPVPGTLNSMVAQVLDAIPPTTDWLVIKGVYTTLLGPGVPGMEHLLLHVECLGKNGIALDEELYKDCFVRMSGANKWLGKKGGKATRTLSRVFIDHQCAQDSGLTPLALEQAHISTSAASTGTSFFSQGTVQQSQSFEV
jgi:hypothetical protein